MRRRDQIRREWTHRRLGLGAVPATDAAMARTDWLLAAVGARRTTSTDMSADGFDAALFDFVCDIDLTAGVREVDATPIPIAALRAQLPTPRRRRLTWQVLVPVASSVAAVAIVATMLLVGGSSHTASPALAATAQSKQLLTHAETLLTAASSAATADRAELVAEAKADLTHVSRLLPLTQPQAQPAIRTQLRLLDRRMKPLAPQPPSRSGSSGGQQTSAPVHRRPPVRQAPPDTIGGGRTTPSRPAPSGSDQTAGDPPATGEGAAGRNPPATGEGSAPQQRPGTDVSPRPQAAGGGAPDQHPPSGGAPRPPRP